MCANRQYWAKQSTETGTSFSERLILVLTSKRVTRLKMIFGLRRAQFVCLVRQNNAPITTQRKNKAGLQ
jgi:hypothetical protein